MNTRRRSSFRGHSSYGTSSASHYFREEERMAAARLAHQITSGAITQPAAPASQVASKAPTATVTSAKV